MIYLIFALIAVIIFSFSYIIYTFVWLSKQTITIKIKDRRQKEVQYIAIPKYKCFKIDFSELPEQENLVQYTESRYAVEEVQSIKIIASIDSLMRYGQWQDDKRITPSHIPNHVILRNQKMEILKLIDPFFQVSTSEYDPSIGNFHPYGGIEQIVKLKILRPI